MTGTMPSGKNRANGTSSYIKNEGTREGGRREELERKKKRSTRVRAREIERVDALQMLRYDGLR